jgi:murein DD-endopeptidase MepM/ murein hydrolase activator NlpD
MKKFTTILFFSIACSTFVVADVQERSSWQVMVERAQAMLAPTEVEIDNKLLQTYQGYLGVWTNISRATSTASACPERVCESGLFHAINEIAEDTRILYRRGLYFVPFHEAHLKVLKDAGIERQKLNLKRGEYLWPVMGIRITSRVGSRWGQIHGGIDVAAERGSVVIGATDGRVMLVGDQGAYGHCVFVENHDGTVAWYAHLTESYVKVGDKIARGQIVGISGNTGRSTGPHLHFEMRTRQGIILDPEHFFFIPFEEHLRKAQQYESTHGAQSKFTAKPL